MLRFMIRVLTGLVLGATALFAADPWRNVNVEDEPNLSGNEVQFLEVGGDGRIWIGSLEGLSYFHQGAFHRVTEMAPKRKRRPRDKQDPELVQRPLKVSAWDVYEAGKVLWIGHGGGIVKLVGEDAERMLGGNTVAPILKHGEALWALATNVGTEEPRLYAWQDDKWEPLSDPAKLRLVDLFHGEGALWAPVDGDGVLELPVGKPFAEAVHHLRATNVTTVLVDSRQRVWCGLWGGGVMVRDDGKWEAHLSKEKSAVLSICEDAKGRIWVATSANGAWVYDGDEWTGHLQKEGSVNLLAATRDGRVWVSSQAVGGLRCWNGEAWVVSLDSPLPMRCLIDAPNGDIWAGGVLDGVHILKQQD